MHQGVLVNLFSCRWVVFIYISIGCFRGAPLFIAQPAPIVMHGIKSAFNLGGLAGFVVHPGKPRRRKADRGRLRGLVGGIFYRVAGAAALSVF
jgi:hypothetical protein